MGRTRFPAAPAISECATNLPYGVNGCKLAPSFTDGEREGGGNLGEGSMPAQDKRTAVGLVATVPEDGFALWASPGSSFTAQRVAACR